VDNGWTPRQDWKKNAVGDWTFRLSEMQEAIPRSLEQKESLKQLKTPATPHA
jgi:hypothetical protein